MYVYQWRGVLSRCSDEFRAKYQIPSTKFQANSKDRNSKFKTKTVPYGVRLPPPGFEFRILNLEFPWYLVLGIWCFSLPVSDFDIRHSIFRRRRFPPPLGQKLPCSCTQALLPNLRHHNHFRQIASRQLPRNCPPPPPVSVCARVIGIGHDYKPEARARNRKSESSPGRAHDRSQWLQPLEQAPKFLLRPVGRTKVWVAPSPPYRAEDVVRGHRPGTESPVIYTQLTFKYFHFRTFLAQDLRH
jgi:hypothetical protein